MTKTFVLLISGLMAGAVGLGTTQGATAQAPSDPEACVEGYVWRGATPGDRVCVPLEVQKQAVEDNSQAEARRSPEGGPWGPNTCLDGYVWRLATPTDLICVVPDIRTTTAQENAEAPNRWKATTRSDGSNTYPFLHPGQVYTVAVRPPPPSGPTEGQTPALVIDAEGPALEVGQGTKVAKEAATESQRFEFQHSSDGVALANSFQIKDRASGLCLTVAGASKGNGARILMEPCEETDNQLWYLVSRGDTFWDLRARHSDKCLTAHNPKLTTPAPGAYVEQWDCLIAKNQAWRLQPGPPPPTQ
ncbi:RICIN domain-containing protein [Streptomyces sp. NPDC060022]|uniref:RICIN domain-containing protein n=1 Tax=Streptomyces sp. NPDC060022 TaxID=3347039 RepID=UPI0036A3AB3B